MDVLKQMRALDEALEGVSPEERALLAALAAKNPKLQVMVPTPGTEPRLNGLEPSVISSLVVNVQLGSEISKRDLVIGAGGNPKSSRDVGKVDKILKTEGAVPELEFKPGQRSVFIRRLTGPSTT